jgi:nucleoside-diphosphate-sugar epimerase
MYCRGTEIERLGSRPDTARMSGINPSRFQMPCRPHNFCLVNTASTELLARQAVQAGIRRLVFVSTIGVHGPTTPIDQPLTEDAPVRPHYVYAQSKWEAELVLREIEAGTGLEVVIVRPPLIYGPNAPGNFGRLLRWVSRGVPLPLGLTRNRRSLLALRRALTPD